MVDRTFEPAVHIHSVTGLDAMSHDHSFLWAAGTSSPERFRGATILDCARSRIQSESLRTMGEGARV